MKPSWDDAPEWANWLAMDGEGRWYWHENEPHTQCFQEWMNDGEMERAWPAGWDCTLESRPTNGIGLLGKAIEGALSALSRKSVTICLVPDKRYPQFAAVEIQLYGGYEPKIGDVLVFESRDKRLP